MCFESIPNNIHSIWFLACQKYSTITFSLLISIFFFVNARLVHGQFPRTSNLFTISPIAIFTRALDEIIFSYNYFILLLMQGRPRPVCMDLRLIPYHLSHGYFHGFTCQGEAAPRVTGKKNHEILGELANPRPRPTTWRTPWGFTHHHWCYAIWMLWIFRMKAAQIESDL